ncbi:MAG: uridine kinase [Bacteroidales bacterium]|nr:uridine kinase [Bacteroidales bacterium]
MLIIGIAGGSGSGKTTVVRKIVESLNKKVAVISQDSYYKDSSHIPVEERVNINFDHPDAIDWDLLCSQLADLRAGKAVKQPIYSYITCTRSKEDTIHIEPAEVIIVEGILIFSVAKLRKLMDIKIFVDAESDERLMRIIYRDILERGRNMDTAFNHYLDTVKPMHLQFIEPSKRYADIIIPEGGHNKVAVDIIVNTIEKALR